MTTAPEARAAARPVIAGGLGWRVRGALRLARAKPLGAFGLAFIALLFFTAIFAEVLATHDPYEFDRQARFQGPSLSHWFGTDNLGRDVYSRLLLGSRIALIVSFSAVGMGTVLNTLVGLTCGYFGGKYDLIVQRVVDFLIAMPGLVIAIVMVAVMGRSVINVILAIVIGGGLAGSRLVRSVALSVKQTEYVLAARAAGAGAPRILWRHVLPQIVPLILIAASAGLGGAILAEAGLSFLGLGPAPPTPTWGAMLSGRAIQFVDENPWSVVFPGVALTLTVLAVNLLGDAMRDLLDPRLRK